MNLPQLNSVSRGKQQVVAFGGLNLTESWNDGELCEARNLSTSAFPCISQRAGRRLVKEYTAPTALYAKRELCVVDGTDFLYGGVKKGTVTEAAKQFASIGPRLVIFPDKAYYDVDKDEFGSLEASYSAEGLVFTASTITTTGPDFPFRKGDAVTLSGCTVNPKNNDATPIIRAVDGKVLTFYDNTFTAGTETGSVTLKREVPDLEYICEWGNRIWGCSPGRIHASKFGDPFNFNCFDGLASDSYYVDVGADGTWTGCTPYASHCCFFMEDTLHKLYGSKPANFQLSSVRVHGVQEGCAGSMVVINETLLYKGRDGVYTYTGGVPEFISAKLGARRFDRAVAGSDGLRYYLAMRAGERWELFVYDVLRGLWTAEDEARVRGFAALDGVLYFLDADGGLYAMEGDADPDGPVRWAATFCPFHEAVLERKGYSRLGLRLDLEAGAWLEVEVACDGGPWKKVCTAHNDKARTLSVPIAPSRCDSFQVRLSGRGRCKLRAMTRTFYVGSER